VGGADEFGAAVGPEQDAVAVEHIVDRENLGAAFYHSRDPADLLGLEQFEAYAIGMTTVPVWRFADSI
jgi:hypothetical protein